MPDVRTCTLLLAGMVLHTGSLADDSVLQTNPFISHVAEAAAPDTAGSTASERTGDRLRLRGTVQAGSQSLANIDGVILGIGQEIDGYTLISVEERHVILERNGARREIIIADKDETGQYE
jgi:hypothetical protein